MRFAERDLASRPTCPNIAAHTISAVNTNVRFAEKTSTDWINSVGTCQYIRQTVARVARKRHPRSRGDRLDDLASVARRELKCAYDSTIRHWCWWCSFLLNFMSENWLPRAQHKLDKGRQKLLLVDTHKHGNQKDFLKMVSQDRSIRLPC